MPVTIRLRRMGRKKLPHFRVVVTDSRMPRDGRFVETLGYYKPLSDPARLVIDLARVDHWISEGATTSDTVRSLISKARKGGTDDVAVGEIEAEERKVKHAEALASKRASEQRAVSKAADQKSEDQKSEEEGSQPAAEAGADAGAEEAEGKSE